MRKQRILIKRLDNLYNKLTNLKLNIKTASLSTALFAGTMAFTPSVNAQTFSAGVGDPFGITDATANRGPRPHLVDLDNDGDLDIIVSHVDLQATSVLLRNDGNGIFQEIARISGVAVNDRGITTGSMHGSIGDVDGDRSFHDDSVRSCP